MLRYIYRWHSSKVNLNKELITNLEETFAIFHKYGLKLNLNKYTFSVKSDKFLGYMKIERGIKVNLDKVQALQHM